MINFLGRFPENLIDIGRKLHRLVPSNVILDAAVDVECRFDSILWADHQLRVGQ